MPNIEQPQSQPPVGPNGHDTLEAETGPDYPHREYKAEDFSQSAINRGQRHINYYISKTGEEVVSAFKEVRNLIAVLSAHGHVDLHALDAAIDRVEQATKKIAGPFPPGCENPNQTKPGSDI
jgi:hypothetical protein